MTFDPNVQQAWLNAGDHAMWAADDIKDRIKEVASCYERPCVLFRPRLSIDGNQWCALYGENLMEGVAGFGDTPEKAMANFDLYWVTPLNNSDTGSKS